jgi:hypothetical protein
MIATAPSAVLVVGGAEPEDGTDVPVVPRPDPAARRPPRLARQAARRASSAGSASAPSRGAHGLRPGLAPRRGDQARAELRRPRSPGAVDDGEVVAHFPGACAGATFPIEARNDPSRRRARIFCRPPRRARPPDADPPPPPRGRSSPCRYESANQSVLALHSAHSAGGPDLVGWFLSDEKPRPLTQRRDRVVPRSRSRVQGEATVEGTSGSRG